MTTNTLLIRHLPISLSKDEIENLLKYIGAVEVTIRESKVKKHSVAFAKFKNEDTAKEALQRLHQQVVLDSKLVVEFANTHGFPDEKKHQDANCDTKVAEESKRTRLQEQFLRNLNNWAVGLNFTLPPPCHLRYRYPPASAASLVNIVNMLCTSTKFYTQVLHLMNKMNLPSPFESDFLIRENEAFNSFIIYILESSAYEKDKSEDADSAEESELESEKEDEGKKDSELPKKRPALSVKKATKKRKLFVPVVNVKTESIKTDVGDVFEKVDREAKQRKIEVKIPSTIVTEAEPQLDKEFSDDKLSEGFGVIYPKSKTDEEEKVDGNVEESTIEKYITSEELASNRISKRDWSVLPIFKNYQPGVPSCRLYIKNLSKHVTSTDLHYIFKKYLIKGIDEQGTMFDVRLMQEGRMKGQAFVTLQNTKQAELALKETNGFIIKDKPMVVQFARSAAAKGDPT